MSNLNVTAQEIKDWDTNQLIDKAQKELKIIELGSRYTCIHVDNAVRILKEWLRRKEFEVNG